MKSGTATAEDTTLEWPARFGSWAQSLPPAETLSQHKSFASWRLSPPSLYEVRQVIAAAREHRTPLFPVSTGRNWGYGSHLPNTPGNIILDLSRLNNISGLDEETGTVRIEPGVTQAQLVAYIKKHAPEYRVNVTGSGTNTSILGNALERGIGYAGEREFDVYAFEVILADGSEVRPSAENQHPGRRQPAGLATDALFIQTNFGVVVGARMRLRPRQECEAAFIITGKLPKLLALCCESYRRELFRLPTHIAEAGRARRLSHGLLRQYWQREPTDEEVTRIFPERSTATAIVSVHGTHRVVRAIRREVKRSRPAGVKLQWLTQERLQRASRTLGRLRLKRAFTRLQAYIPLLALTWGETTDAGLQSLEGFSSGNPDSLAYAALYGNAVSAARAEDVDAVRKIVGGLWENAAFTWTLLDHRHVITIYTLHFSAGESVEAHAANAKIVSQLRAGGYCQYRLDIASRPATKNNLSATIKTTLDPLNIISPGRYEPA